MVEKINKRGQDLSIGTLILIVLGIIVLVLLILGFSMGWSNLWEKINIFGGGNSMGDVVIRCKSDVETGNNYDYCQDFKKLKGEGGATEYVNCLDERIDTSLESKITCDKPAASYVREKCNALVLAGSLKGNTKVNNNVCPLVSCEALGGKEMSNNDKCEGLSAKTIEADFVTGEMDCCVNGDISGAGASITADTVQTCNVKISCPNLDESECEDQEGCNVGADGQCGGNAICNGESQTTCEKDHPSCEWA